MTRVSTLGQNDLLLTEVLRNEARVFESQQKVASGVESPDYKGIARDVATLSGAKTLEKRTESFLATNRDVARRIEINDVALQSLFDAASRLRQDILSAINTGSGLAFRDKIDDLFDSAVNILNSKENGRYIFAGSRTDAAPVLTTTSAQLTALGSGNHTGAFTNNTIKAQAKIDENQTMTYGVLASDIGDELFESIQRLMLFDDGTNNFGFSSGGPFGNALNDDQKNFLLQELQQATQAFDDLNQQVAFNGINASRVEVTQNRHIKDLDFLRIFIGDIEDVNAAEAISKLNLDQLALDASFRVYAQLTRLSLIDFL